MSIPAFLPYATRWTVLCLECLNYQATERLQDDSGISGSFFCPVVWKRLVASDRVGSREIVMSFTSILFKQRGNYNAEKHFHTCTSGEILPADAQRPFALISLWWLFKPRLSTQ